MTPKPPLNVNGVRFERPRPLPVARCLQVRPEDHDRYHAACQAHAEHLRQYPPSAIEDGAYDPVPDRPFADRHPFLNALGWMLLVGIATMVATFLVAILFGTRAHGQTLPTSRPAASFPPGVITAWYYPPLENLATVKARGCNAVVGPELGNPPRVTVQQWCAEAQRLGLGIIGDRKLLVAGYVPPTLVGWIVRDEPTSANHNYPPESIEAEAAAFRDLRPDLPVLCTHAGDKLTSAGPRDDPPYARYVAAVDASLEDWYPINRQVDRYWGPTQNPPLKVKALNYLKARGARVVGSVIETSWQKLNKAGPLGRGPTPDEYERQVNDALAAGARIIVHFSTAEYGYPWPLAYDPTPPDVVARITAVNARLNPPAAGPLAPTPDVLTARVDALEQRTARAEAATEDLKARLRQALAPATTQPNP